MADIIHLLPDSVANQIAAGEVIQRPASVIKELVENAVDAEATHIDVLVVEAGRTSIQVIDDGKGMSETDARLAFERHATSKITEASDLYALHTMGFRGEALPSIAAVAQLTLRTHARDEELGTMLTVEGGKITSQEEDGCPTGTNFLVQNLFYNIPARRKFLKSNQTELSNIIQELQKIVLVNPEISFTFSHNGNLLYTYPAESLHHRIATVFGKNLSSQLLSVDVDTTLCKITGFVGRPDSSKKRGTSQYFFVNGRYMRHPYFHKAVQNAFEDLIPATEQVPYFLYFQVDPSTIDVNIHPTKTEIKFENEQAIWQITMAAVKEALGRFNAVPTIDFDVEGKPSDIPVFSDAPSSTRISPRPLSTNYNPFRDTESHSQRPSTAGWETLFQEMNTSTITEERSTPEFSFEDSPFTNDIERGSAHFQYRGQYIITEIRTGLMFVDQHRAHVRVLYNRYKEQMLGHNGVSQGLLFPEMVQVSPADVALMDEIQEELSSVGFSISNLGGGSYSIQSVPAGIDGLNPQALLEDMLTSLREGGQGIEDELQHRIALTMARSAAIPVGQVLSQQEMESLLTDLFQTDNPNQTPDGRAIIVKMEHQNVEKMFK